MKSYKIHLIRHGRTQANEEGLYVGRTDLPLSPGGLNALLALREGGGYPTAGRFFTSPLTRCRQTLEVLYPGCRQEVVEAISAAGRDGAPLLCSRTPPSATGSPASGRKFQKERMRPFFSGGSRRHSRSWCGSSCAQGIPRRWYAPTAALTGC